MQAQLIARYHRLTTLLLLLEKSLRMCLSIIHRFQVFKIWRILDC